MTISLIRTLLLYTVVILAVRLMGKRQISELQTSELVVTLLISDIAAIPMQNTEQSLVSGFLPIIVLVSCEILISAIMLKSSKFRKFICGKPLIVVNDGKVDQAQMRRLRMSIEDLSVQLRQLDVFNIEDIAYAIVETNGKLSILKKPELQQVTPKMLNIDVKDKGISTVVINDGMIAPKALSLCKLDKKWINETLKKQNININDVFIMTANKNKDFYIIKKDEKQ